MCLCALLLGNQVYSMNAKIYVHCNITLQRVYGSEVNLKPPKSMLPYLHPPNTANAFFISVTYFLFHIVPLCVLFCFVFYYQFVATDWNLDRSLFFFFSFVTIYSVWLQQLSSFLNDLYISAALTISQPRHMKFIDSSGITRCCRDCSIFYFFFSQMLLETVSFQFCDFLLRLSSNLGKISIIIIIILCILCGVEDNCKDRKPSVNASKDRVI